MNAEDRGQKVEIEDKFYKDENAVKTAFFLIPVGEWFILHFIFPYILFPGSAKKLLGLTTMRAGHKSAIKSAVSFMVFGWLLLIEFARLMFRINQSNALYVA